jgi:hypothetical protein
MGWADSTWDSDLTSRHLATGSAGSNSRPSGSKPGVLTDISCSQFATAVEDNCRMRADSDTRQASSLRPANMLPSGPEPVRHCYTYTTPRRLVAEIMPDI